MNSGPLLISEASIHGAWTSAMNELMRPGVERLVRLTVSISIDESSPANSPAVQRVIDEELEKRGLYSTNTTANTIFPASLWNRNAPREQLFERYKRIVSILRKWDGGNRYGTYFDRMIGYGTVDETDTTLNQLEKVLAIFQRGVRRRSALQVAIYDPTYDLTAQTRRGFPCMQYVTFDPTGEALSVTATYTTQYIFDRGYGNYLGILRLGEFMASEMGLTLREVNVITMRAAIGGRGSITKAAGKKLVERIGPIMSRER